MSKSLRVLLVALLAAVPIGFAAAASAEDPPAPAPSLSIAASSTYVAASGRVALSFTVANGNNGTLNLTFAQAGAAPQSGKLAENVNDDTLHYTFNPVVNTTITAEIGGTTASIALRVRLLMGTQHRGDHGVQGRYLLLKKGSSPTFRTAEGPARPGKICLRHEVQRLRAGAWHRVARSACRTVGAKGQVDWRWAGKHASRTKFRVRATFAGDSVNAAGPGPWVYFKFR